MRLADRMVTHNQASGWECPKCGKVNGPTVSKCDHEPLVVVTPEGDKVKSNG